MKIQSTKVSTSRSQNLKSVVEKKREYQEIRDRFEQSEEKAEALLKRGFTLSKGVPFVIAAGLLAGQMAGKVPIVAPFGDVALASCCLAIPVGLAIHHFLTMPAVKAQGLSEQRPELIESRDNYRQAILDEMNDPNVIAETQERWDKLKSEEFPRADVHNSADSLLNKEVNSLERLYERRQLDGWASAHAQNVKNPDALGDALNKIQSASGLLTTLEEAFPEKKN